MLFTELDCIGRIQALDLEESYRPLQKLKRTGWVLRNIPNPETVAEHQISATLMVTNRFRSKIEDLDIINIPRLQDIILIHDLAEGDPNVGDITPLCGVPEADKRAREMEAIHKILRNKPDLLDLWYDYEDARTPEGRLAKEIDKLQAIERARYYEDLHGVTGLTEEFYTGSVIKRTQIKTDFLRNYADELHRSAQK